MSLGNDVLAPGRCVLMVIDKQRWYLDPAVSPFLRKEEMSEMRRAVAELDDFIEVARDAGVPVCWTTMTEGDDHAPPNVLARWERRPEEPRMRRLDGGYEFVGASPASGDSVFEKVYPDAFSSAALEEHLSTLGRTTLVLIGGYAGRCVLATAFGAQNRGYEVVVPRDLAEPHPWQNHEEKVFLAIIDSIVGQVRSPREIADLWRRE
ncbi:MAG: isochorismatase family protein [Aeromicrobium sp.]|uniref:cysteine hydrolase family protein n=1 Tax=Aeromicrobium sp. TaxID=1871063 RepID=UPI0039E3B547